MTTKIIIVAILIYTVLVSGITVGIDRAVIKHRVEKAFDDAFSGEILDSTNDEDKPEDKKVTPVNLNQKFTVGGIAEVTFTKSEWVNEIVPSKASDGEFYSYFKNRNYTVHPGFEGNIIGGNYQRELGVVVDGNFITAKSMYYSLEFGFSIYEYFFGKEKTVNLRKSCMGE